MIPVDILFLLSHAIILSNFVHSPKHVNGEEIWFCLNSNYVPYMYVCKHITVKVASRKL